MPQYILRHVPAELWANVRARATHDGWPLRALLLQLLEDYADHHCQPSVPPPGHGAGAARRSEQQRQHPGRES